MIRRVWMHQPPILPILIAISAMGSIVVYLATSGYGAGLSSDAIRIVSTGQNFIEGRGLITSSGAPLIFAPPYYSILLGLLAVVFHSDVFTVGMILNILVFGAIIFSSGSLFLTILPDKPCWAIGACLVVATSPSLIRICANVAPDPLFILWVVLFLLWGMGYLRNPSPKTIAWMFIAALLASSQRYLGFAVVLAGAGLILWQDRNHLLQAGLQAGGFTFLASTPTLSYILFHNYLGYGTLTGPRLDPQPLGNLSIALEKLIHWFIPGTVTTHTGFIFWVILGLFLLVGCLIFIWKRDRLRNLLRQGAILPSTFFLVIYGLTLIFMLSYTEHRPLLWDRIHIVILVPILVILIATINSVVRSMPRYPQRWLNLSAMAVFLLWLIYPIGSSYKHIVQSIQNGEASLYNIHNIRSIRGSALAGYLTSHRFPSDARLFSNYNETAWFLTRQPVEGVPTMNSSTDWPDFQGEAYLIWFNLPELNYMPKTMLSVEEISTRTTLEKVYEGWDGSVYRLNIP